MEQPRRSQAVLERPAATRRALVLMNLVARRHSPDEVRRLVLDKLEPAGWSCEFVELRSAAELDEAANRGTNGDYGIVIVAGGDGTVTRVSRHLVGKNVPLAILPVGRDNSVAFDLGIPEEPAQAASLLVGDHEVGRMDSLLVGGSHFFLQVGTAAVAGEDEGESLKGASEAVEPAGPGAAPRKAANFETRRFSLMVDGRHYRVSGWQVIVVNAGAFGPGLLQGAPPNLPSDGVADLIVLRVRSTRDLLRAGLRFLGLRRDGGDPGISVSFHRVRDRAAVIPDRPMCLEGDGEVIGTTPLEVKVAPGAVKVLVPRGATEVGPSVPAFPAVEARPRWIGGRLRMALLHQLSPLGALDTAIFMAVAAMPHPRVLNLFMQTLEVGMASGRGWIAGTAGLDLVRRRRPWRGLLNLAPALWLTSFSTEFPIKRIFARPRPFVTLVLTSVVGRKPSSYSFPSGHSAASFAGAWLLSRRHPRWTPAFYAFAALVAFSRVYQGAHYPSDVTIGAAVGTGLAAVYNSVLGRVFERAARVLTRL